MTHDQRLPFSGRFFLLLGLLAGCGDDGTVAGDGSTGGDGTDTFPPVTQGQTSDPTGDDTTAGTSQSTTATTAVDDTGSTTTPTTASTTDATDGTDGTDGTGGTDTTGVATTGTGGTTGTSSGSTGVASVCGDGIVEGDEVCDDGNTDDGDACSADCQTVGDCVVPVTHADIQTALDDVTCTTVYVMPGVYAENLDVQRDVTVEPAAPGTVSVDGGGTGTTVTVFVGQTVTLRGLTITGGSAEQGAGIANAGALTLDGCEVSGNDATGAFPRGGGLFSITAVTLIDTVVTGNSASGGAAGATVFGAGLYVSGADLTLSGASSVTDNHVDVAGVQDVLAGGGGIFLRNGTLTLTPGSVVDGNTVTVDGEAGAMDGFGALGGGIFLRGGTLSVQDGVSITNNAVQVQGTDASSIIAFGGGVYLLEADATLVGPVSINDNSAIAMTPSAFAAGGGMHADEVGAVSMTGVTLQNNAATSTGGVSGNAVLARGGGLYLASQSVGVSTLSLSDCSIRSNEAATEGVTDGTAQGGGLYAIAFIDATVSVSVDSSTFDGNAANGQLLASGGGLEMFAEGTSAQASLDLLNATFFQNTASATDAARAGGVGLGAGFGTAVATGRARNLSIAGNVLTATTTSGEGLWVGAESPAAATLDLGGTVAYGNGSSDCATAGVATINAVAPNLWGDASGCPAIDLTDAIVGTDPMLGTLVDAGGTTLVLLPDAGSAVIDALPVAQCLDLDGDPLVLDQRDATRPDVTDCDLGAVERQAGDP